MVLRCSVISVLTYLHGRYYGTGFIFGKMLCIIICVDYILLAFLDFLFPREDIDLAPKFELSQWQEVSSRTTITMSYFR